MKISSVFIDKKFPQIACDVYVTKYDNGIIRFKKDEARSKLSQTDPKFKPLYKAAGWKRNQRLKEKVKKKNTWYSENKKNETQDFLREQTFQKDGRSRKLRVEQKLRIKTTTVMFVPSSKGGILVRKLREGEEILAELTGFRIKYQEAGGTQLKSMFSTDLGRGAHCGRGNCHPCSMEGESRQNCRVKNIVYESTCLICNEPKKATSLQEGLHEEQGNKEVSRQLAVCSNSRQNQD